MKKSKVYLNVLLNSLIAGILISLGGFCFLKISEIGFPGAKVVGAIFFGIGLILICNFGFYLYTGKICYLIDQIKAKNTLCASLSLIIGLVGNFVGCYVAGTLLRYTTGDNLFINAIAEAKINDSMMNLFIKGIFCGMMIYLAVEGFKESKHELGKYSILILCVAGFIVCGYEHCVANMFYFSIAGCWNVQTLVITLVVALGNSVGGMLIPFIRGFIND